MEIDFLKLLLQFLLAFQADFDVILTLIWFLFIVVLVSFLVKLRN